MKLERLKSSVEPFYIINCMQSFYQVEEVRIVIVDYSAQDLDNPE